MVAPPACVLGCGRKFLFCSWSSTPPKNWTFLGRLLVSQIAANIAKRHADQTRSGAPRPVGLLHRISTETPVLCAFPPSQTAISLLCLCIVFYSLFVYTCVCVFLHIQSPLQECRSIRSGASGLPYYCAPLVCVSAVMELLAV